MVSEMRVNVGCGRRPTDGWRNFDNSPSLRIAKIPGLARILRTLRLLRGDQFDFIDYARTHQIEFGDVRKRLPLPDNAVEVLYSSHMIEHLDRREMDHFLQEALRVLMPGGVIRLAFPDIRKQANHYMEHGDADRFIAGTLMTEARPATLTQRIQLLIVGYRQHLWMYDGQSLSRLLTQRGFVNAQPRPQAKPESQILARWI
jgi:SAM-dependent methyltransferase